jgi:hypothetical protein
MTFATDQMSVQDSAPVELYEFATPSVTYYRTSFQEDYDNSGHVYTATPMLRTEVPVASPGESRDIYVELPVSDAVVQNHIVGIPPVIASAINVTIYRLQQLSGARVIWWQGPVRGVNFMNRMRVAKFRIPDGLEDAMRTELPRPRAQRLCNHALYDTMCQILEADHDHTTTVVSVDGTEVVVNSVDTAETYEGGQLIFNSERRGIVTQDGTTLRLDAPFRGLATSSSITLLAGCKHNVTYCFERFNNVINYGGAPGLPDKNPHIVRRSWED